jgi:glutaminase
VLIALLSNQFLRAGVRKKRAQAMAGGYPVTKERVVDPAICHYTLAVMTTAGLYETSGDWLYDIGLPGKSGIGGGIVTVSPGKGGLGTFAPPLDKAGTSVKASSRETCNLLMQIGACGYRWQLATCAIGASLRSAVILHSTSRRSSIRLATRATLREG